MSWRGACSLALAWQTFSLPHGRHQQHAAAAVLPGMLGVLGGYWGWLRLGWFDCPQLPLIPAHLHTAHTEFASQTPICCPKSGTPAMAN